MKDSCPATRATMCDGGTPMPIRDLGKLSYLRDTVGSAGSNGFRDDSGLERLERVR
jgi:hypothetical protein